MNFSMMKQAMELKSKMEKIQKELSKARIEVADKDNLIKITTNGQQKILSLKIEPEAIDPSHPDKLEKLLIKTITSAMEESKKLANERLGEVTNGINIPGLTS
ncbi:MAG: YbaB/EbfC family nucleoid-associated protein [Dehalococcoidales bacterium]|jgi:DNA-binding YbaB/EbfC family protein|nr:YbaB/EbfC family nucleoid-associated protein [Dehalococcoidales bacterium]MDX9803062.1 YbaB/EbfC family nucleoid-associated protein [Dehalococcoidales bacterium]